MTLTGISFSGILSRMKQIKQTLLTIILVTILASSLWGQTEDKDEKASNKTQENSQINSPLNDNLEFSLIITGQTDPLYVWWGHIGIIVDDFENNQSVMYDFGNFNFADSNFYKNFLEGNFFYRGERMYPQAYINYVKGANRLLRIHKLNLPPQKELELYKKLEWLTLEENKVYLYHHYNNNCSTKIRDMINEALSGQLKEKTSFQRGETFRKLSRYYSAHNLFGDLMIHFVLSGKNDSPITFWDEMFLPDKFEEAILDFTYTDENNNEIPLVSGSMYFDNDYKGFFPKTNLSGLWVRGLIIGFIMALIAFFIAVLEYNKGKKFRIIYGSYTIILSLVIFVLGTVIFFMMNFTKHDYSFGNLNLFICHPLALTGVGLGIWYFFQPKKAKKILLWFWTAMAFSVFVLIIVKIFPSIYQMNKMFILIAMPLYLVLGIPGDYAVRYVRKELKKRKKPRKYLD